MVPGDAGDRSSPSQCSQKELAMSTNQRSRMSLVGIAAILSFVLVAPVGAQEDDPTTDLAPAVPSWDESSGYGTVEASRAARTIGLPREPTSIAPSRVNTALEALEDGDLGSLQEEALAAIVAAAMAWDDLSGYGSVEASRAARSHLVIADEVANQVSSDVRWAPVAADVASSSNDLSAALASGQRAESAHLAMVPLPGTR
jgi:hypothetical protein